MDLQTTKQFNIEDWGLVPYEEALTRQLLFLNKVASGDPDTLIFCSHPPVVTLGRSTVAGDVTTWDGEIVNIQRGGRATYHGPSQLVVYPILNLNLQDRDLHKYLRNLELVIIKVLKEYNLDASSIKDATGVWVGNKKIASIGIGVKRWVSYHGIALNVDHDSAAFQGLKPCGFTTDTMTSMQVLLNKKIDLEELKQKVINSFKSSF